MCVFGAWSQCVYWYNFGRFLNGKSHTKIQTSIIPFTPSTVKGFCRCELVNAYALYVCVCCVCMRAISPIKYNNEIPDKIRRWIFCRQSQRSQSRFYKIARFDTIPNNIHHQCGGWKHLIAPSNVTQRYKMENLWARTEWNRNDWGMDIHWVNSWAHKCQYLSGYKKFGVSVCECECEQMGVDPD